MKYGSANSDWGALTGIEERLFKRRSTIGEGGGGMKQPTMWNWWVLQWLLQWYNLITMEGQNLPWYSSWENITITFFPVAYSDSVQWIAAATSANVCGERDWNNYNVFGCRPRLLAVKKNWSLIKSSTSIWVNQDFSSWMTFKRYASSERSFPTWIRSSVSDPKSNRFQQTIVPRGPSAKCPRMVLIFSFKYVYFWGYHHKSNQGAENGMNIYSFPGLWINFKRWTTRQLTLKWCYNRSTSQCPLMILGFSCEIPSFVNHLVHLIWNIWPRSICEYDHFHEPFHYLNSRLLVFSNVVISTGLWLRNILVSSSHGKWDGLGGYSIRLV